MGTRRTIQPGPRSRHYIREWRKFRGLTQEQLADRLEVATSTISQLENYKQGYSQAILEALAGALMCEPWQLLKSDPTKEGEVIDLFDGLDDDDKRRAAQIISALKSA